MSHYGVIFFKIMALQAGLADVQGIFLCGGCLLVVATATFIMELFWKQFIDFMPVLIDIIRLIVIIPRYPY